MSRLFICANTKAVSWSCDAVVAFSYNFAHAAICMHSLPFACCVTQVHHCTRRHVRVPTPSTPTSRKCANFS